MTCNYQATYNVTLIDMTWRVLLLTCNSLGVSLQLIIRTYGIIANTVPYITAYIIANTEK